VSACPPTRGSLCWRYVTKRILIADDHPSVLQALRAWLESNPDWEICGEAVDGQQAVAKATELCPDLIILDFAMPRMNGLSAAQEIHKLLPKVPIVMYTFYRSVLDLEANKHGIRKIVDKTEPGVLISTVEELLSAEATSQPSAALDETSKIPEAALASLTPDVTVAAAPVFQQKAVEEPKTATTLPSVTKVA
jgi:DNA-binding NarL/FixJ family response regulator